MAALAARAPAVILTAGCLVRSATGAECAAAPTWPAGAEGRQPPPAASRFPHGRRPGDGQQLRRPAVSVSLRAALPRSAIIPRGAHRAPLKPFVKKVVTGQDRRIAAPHYAYRSEAYWYDIQYQY